MPSKKLSIIIVNFRSEQCLSRCIASIYDNFNVDLEIIIVNNDQTEKLENVCRDFPNVRIINRGKNIGFGAGNNLGAKYVNGKIILFLNPDTEILSENIEDVLAQFDKDCNLGVLGAQLINKTGKVQDWSVGNETGLWDIARNNLKIPRSRKIWESKKSLLVDWVSGTAFFIRRDIFEKIGKFDENFFMYFEDIDLCRRTRKAGKKVLYFPDFEVRHYGGESYKNKNWQKKNYYDSQEYYFKKHCGAFQAKILKITRYFLGL